MLKLTVFPKNTGAMSILLKTTFPASHEKSITPVPCLTEDAEVCESIEITST